tara:strand:+ start:75 stop:1049 length:975 start_codon:yes stop_codon:yes gene_type:complete
MARITSKSEFKEYCLRKLGKPVIQINIDDTQVEDRVDDAFEYYRDYHYDATEKVFLKHEITGSTLNLTTTVGTEFTDGETITGDTSGATAIVHSTKLDGTTSDIVYEMMTNSTPPFQVAETITGGTSGKTGVISSVDKGDIENGYLTTSDLITGIKRVIPLYERDQNVKSFFDIRYQMHLNDVYNLQSAEMLTYEVTQSHMQLVNDMITGRVPIRFNRHQNQLHLDINWAEELNIGEYLVIECYRYLDPTVYQDVWNDRWLKRYATALIKKQWGENLSKYSGIQMPGGVEFNGQRLIDESNEEITRLEEEMSSSYELPVDFMVG